MRNLQSLQNMQSFVRPKESITLSEIITGLSGLAAYYPLNETSGNAINQAPATRGTLDGVPAGVTQGATGLVGNAYSFDGNGDLVAVADNATLDFSTAMSLIALVRVTSGNPYPSIMTKQSGNTGYEFYVDRDLQKVVFKIGIGASSVSALSTATVSFGTWYMLGASYNKTALKVYINGVEAASQNETTNVANSSADLSIGGIGGGFSDGNFTGLMQHIALFNQALTEAQFLQLTKLAGLA